MRKAAGAFLLVLTLSPAAPAQSDTFAVVAPYVVVLSQTHAGRTSRGTGWIAAGGRVFTAAHVILQSTLPVLLVREQGPVRPDRGRWARVLHINRDQDVAVLDAGLPPRGLQLVDHPVSPGDEVWIFGYEFVAGSAVLRMARASVGQRFRDFFQVDGPAQPGFSGGPVTTRGGRVAGHVSFALGPNPNLTYMVPAHVLAALAPGSQPRPTGTPSQRAPAYFFFDDQFTEWFSDPQMRLLFYSAVTDVVTLLATVDPTPTLTRYAHCAPAPTLSRAIPFLDPRWTPRARAPLAYEIIQQVLQRCPGPGARFSNPYLTSQTLDQLVYGTHDRAIYVALGAIHDGFMAAYEAETRPSKTSRQIVDCLFQLEQMDDLIDAYRTHRRAADLDQGVGVALLTFVQACIRR